MYHRVDLQFSRCHIQQYTQRLQMSSSRSSVHRTSLKFSAVTSELLPKQLQQEQRRLIFNLIPSFLALLRGDEILCLPFCFLRVCKFFLVFSYYIWPNMYFISMHCKYKYTIKSHLLIWVFTQSVKSLCKSCFRVDVIFSIFFTTINLFIYAHK